MMMMHTYLPWILKDGDPGINCPSQYHDRFSDLRELPTGGDRDYRYLSRYTAPGEPTAQSVSRTSPAFLMRRQLANQRAP